jgi:trypsin
VSVPFTYGPGVQQIALTRAEPGAGVIAVVSGWATLSSGSSSLPTQLQAVDVIVVSGAECNSAYSSYGGITENMICAAAIGGGKDACHGDSGGPLVSRGNLVGILSWGAGCGEATYPGVYSNIATLRDFITNQTGIS